MYNTAKEKQKNRLVALTVVFAMIFTQFASTVNVFASTEELPFKTTVSSADGKNCPIKNTGKTISHDIWGDGEPGSYRDIPLYKCEVPKGAEYVNISRNGDNDVKHNDMNSFEDMEYKHYLSSITTGPLLGEENYIIIQPDTSRNSSVAMYFEEAEEEGEEGESIELPFKSKVTDGSKAYPVELTDKKLGDNYGTYDTYKCIVPAGTKKVTLEPAKNEDFFKNDNPVKGEFDIDGKTGEENLLIISVKGGSGWTYYTLYFEEETAKEKEPLPFKTTITDIDDDEDIYEIESADEIVTTEFKMDLPLYVCKVPENTDTVKLHKNGDFKYLENNINTIDIPEGHYSIKDKMGKENFFIVETKLTGTGIDFAIYFEEDPELEKDVADKAELRKTVAAAEELIRNEKLYDEKSIAELKDSVKEAGEILKDKKSEQKAVNEKDAELKDQIKNMKSGYVVYFETKEGDPVYSEDGVFTLSALNEGKFKVSGKGVTNVNWNCVEKVTEETAEGKTESYYKFWINEDGTYQPKEPKMMDATVTFDVDGETVKRTFRINTIATDIKDIKVYSDGKEVTDSKPLILKGREWATITAKGLIGNEWVDIPAQSFYIVPQENTHVQGNRIALWEDNKDFKVTVSLYGDAVKTSFTAKASYVPVTSFEIKVPKTTWILDAWNPSSQNYLGLRYYADPAQDRGYYIDMKPANASNWDMEWKSSDESVAYFDPLNDNGIVPKKAGKVEFTVTSKDNKKATDKISLEFKYKNPLKEAKAPFDTEDEKLVLNANEIREFEMATKPENATERRFNWSYSKEGVVKVDDKLEYISFGEQEENDGEKIGELKVTHRVTAESVAKDTTVIVTGTPVDDTENCKPVKFAVTVKADENHKEPVDNIKQYRKAYSETAAKYAGKLMSYGDEWALIGLTRGGQALDQNVLDRYYQSVLQKVKSADGNLSSTKYTEYSRVILGLTAAGFDPQNVGGYNLVEKLGDFDKVKAQGINGPIWALIALDSGNYKLPADATTTRDRLVDEILSAQVAGGGFAFSGDKADSDMTAMAVQALAPYYNTNEAVKAAVDSALDVLSEMQTLTGAFVANGGSETAESTAQVIVALTALGINPETDARFIKNGKTVMDGLMGFYAGDGQFKHVKSGDNNAMATEQSLYALAAYLRFRDGKTSLYNMSDVVKKDTPEEPETVLPVVGPEGDATISSDKKTAEVNPSEIKNITGELTVKLEGNKTVKYDKKAMDSIKKQIPADAEKVQFVVEATRAGINAAQKKTIEESKALEVFSVELMVTKADGTTLRIHDFGDGKVQVTVPFANPENLKLEVYRVEEDGTIKLMNSTYKDGYLSWITDGHSYYMVAEAGKAVAAGAEDTAAKAPKTGDSNTMIPWMLIILIAASGVVIARKKNN